MVKKTENTAVTTAMWQPVTDKKDKHLAPERYKAECSYITSMRLFDKMLETGLITTEEYRKIDTIMADKYGSYLYDLYR